MTNSGNPDPVNEAAATEQSGVPWWALVAMLLALVLIVIIGVRVGGVLYAMIFPPSPPIPLGASQVSHNSSTYGFDDWVYTLRPTPCLAVESYVDAGATCELQPGHCTEDTNERKTSALAARCTGEEVFSMFAMRYEAEIYAYPQQTEIHLQREIAWGRPNAD